MIVVPEPVILIDVYNFSGQLKIAEVASRFHSLPQFLLKVEQFGFYQVSKVQASILMVKVKFTFQG